MKETEKQPDIFVAERANHSRFGLRVADAGLVVPLETSTERGTRSTFAEASFSSSLTPTNFVRPPRRGSSGSGTPKRRPKREKSEEEIERSLDYLQNGMMFGDNHTFAAGILWGPYALISRILFEIDPPGIPNWMAYLAGTTINNVGNVSPRRSLKFYAGTLIHVAAIVALVMLI